jgi:HlyD family secretion protein
VTVDAFPNRPFDGSVLKIEPQAQTEQNVTMFPVLVRIDNRAGLLRPGMNAEVEIHVGERPNVLAVPNAALRTQRDVGSAAQVLGLSPEAVDRELAAEQQGGQASMGGAAGADSSRHDSAGGATMTLGNGRTVTLPAGVSEAQVRSAFMKRRSGGELTAEEAAILEKVRQAGGGGGGPGGGTRRGSAGSEGLFGGRFIVFVKRPAGPTPVWVRTGLTDLDYSEVVSGLSESDSVLVLPSASLVQSQQEMQERTNRMTGGGGAVPGMRQQQQPAGGAR